MSSKNQNTPPNKIIFYETEDCKRSVTKLEEIREIRASERMAYQKITDIYAILKD